MIKKKEEMRKGPIEIDLTGPDGNVFALMGIARSLAKQIYGRGKENIEMDEDDADIDDILAEFTNEGGDDSRDMGEYITRQMRESDYDHAVEVFDKYFGRVCILYR